MCPTGIIDRDINQMEDMMKYTDDKRNIDQDEVEIVLEFIKAIVPPEKLKELLEKEEENE
jgi:uncharacterized membrane protein YvbJ